MTHLSPSQWHPQSDQERSLVLAELDAILGSHHFRGSKRYPALLRYVVLAALDGHATALKERTLGVEVFGRDPQYDTNTDPVVRISAGEVRKRIAQYYHENEENARVRIEMPLGSYAPEFLLSEPAALPAPAGDDPAQSVSVPRLRTRRVPLRLLWAALLLLLALAGVAAIVHSYRQSTASGATTTEKLLAPLFKSSRPILIVVGTSHPPKMAPETPSTSFTDHTTGPYHHVSIATAIALSNIVGLLRQCGHSYEIKEDTETSLTDVRSRPLILIGATNNVWTMRLVNPLRFHFVRDTLIQLQDARNPNATTWSINFSKPYASVAHDYGLVARFHDSTTEDQVLVVAGVGPYGTEAASEFVASGYLDDLVRRFPPGWENRNFEIVLKTDIIDSKAGPPVMIDQTIW